MDAEIQWILSNLTDEQLLTCHNRLALYAWWCCGKWRPNDREGLSEDLVQEAWARVLAGTRRWPNGPNPEDLERNISQSTIESLSDFMKSTIKSLVHAVGHSEAGRKTVSLDAESERISDSGERYEVENVDYDLLGFLCPSELSPEEQVLANESVALVRQQIADRAELLELHAHLRNGLKAGEIATAMNTDPKIVHGWIRCFKRRTKPIRDLFSQNSRSQPESQNVKEDER
jgi:hypothetical protein